MKPTAYFLALALAACVLLFSDSAFAQEEEEGHIYVVSTFKIAMPEGGSGDERDSLLMELIEAQKSNEKVLSSKNLRHRYGSDFRDWVVIAEYATWADIEEAANINQELNRKKWPDDKKRAAFFQKLFKYFPTHSDEIYTNLPKFDK